MITDEEIIGLFCKVADPIEFGRSLYQLGRQHQRESDAALCDRIPIRFGNDGLWRPEIKELIRSNTGELK